ncbi:MAG: NAD(P)-dependent oxidoreductase [Opitutaceae bacterium]|nr:NAD(P)-dependent oxidoreductase [Cephaloticoccus sp.]MCP5529805.1 NAD(P)-dependent oxidoreductase [Opitutaceae bacterium]
MVKQAIMKIGILGMGIIGRIWAGHYQTDGMLAGTWNRTPQPDAPAWCDTPEAVAEAADVIQIVVADPPAVESVLNRILPKLGPGKIVVQSSTIDPASSDKFHSLVTGTGARYLEAPFTGSKPGAETRKTVYYLGGDEALIAELKPFFDVVSQVRIRIGDHRQACTLKLAMNLNLAVQLEALCESLAMVRRSGVSDDIYFNVLNSNAACSGLTKLKEPKLRNADWSPQFSTKHMAKDMRLASSINGCEDFPVLDAVRHRLAEAERAGFADEDFAAVMKLLG